MIRVDPPGRKPAGGRDEQPVVGTADQAHEKRLNGIEIADFIEGFIQQMHIISMHNLILRLQLRFANEDRVGQWVHQDSL
jgi:hypothetical protein